jgi:ribokinase
MSANDVPAFDVIVIGSLNLDLVATASRFPGPGETVHGSTFDEIPGGKGLNQAVAAARAGASVAFVGAVGDDPAGERLRDVVRAEGIDDTALAALGSTPSGRALITVDDRGENSIVVVGGANKQVEPGELASARVVLAQLETNLDAVVDGLRAARAAGAITILNPAPADQAPDDVLALCDVIVPNEHELDLLGGIDALRARTGADVVVTRGAAGADVVTASGTAHVDAFAVVPRDTTGAGDAFCGALAARLAAGDELTAAVRVAAAAGALATTRSGAVPSLPTRAEIDTLLGTVSPTGGATESGQPGAAGRTGDVGDVADATAAADLAPTPVTTGASDVAAAYLAALSSGVPDRVAALVTEDFVNDHASSLGSGCVGRDEYRRRLPGFMASFPGLVYDIERLVDDGTWVAATYRMSAASNGAPIDIRGVMVIETRDGLVARRTDYWDSLTFLRQTGHAE